jgi:hypothetical protein
MLPGRKPEDIRRIVRAGLELRLLLAPAPEQLEEEQEDVEHVEKDACRDRHRALATRGVRRLTSKIV